MRGMAPRGRPFLKHLRPLIAKEWGLPLLARSSRKLQQVLRLEALKRIFPDALTEVDVASAVP